MDLQKHFNKERFYKCLKYDLALNRKMYALTIIGLIITLFIIDFFTLNTASKSVNFNELYYTPMFMFFLILCSIISAGTSFSDLRSSNKSINYLLLPVSSFEKFLVQFLIRIVAFIILYFFIFWLTFKLAFVTYNIFGYTAYNVKSYTLLSPFQWQDNITLYMIITTSITSILFAFAGATYFKKYALFKSIFTFAIVAIIWFVLMIVLSHIFYNHSINEFFAMKLKEYTVYENFSSKEIYFIVTFFCISILLLPLAYFKLKEKEV